jgi:hypothetical protein
MRRSPPGQRFQHAVAFCVHGIGDEIMTLPALRAFAQLCDGRLTPISGAQDPRLFFGDRSVRRYVSFGKHWNEDGHLGFDAEDLANRTGNCDLFVSFVPRHSRSLGRFLSRLEPACSVGFNPCFSDAVPLIRALHSTDLAFTAVDVLEPGLTPALFAARAPIPLEAEQRAVRVLADVPETMRLLVVYTETKSRKRWPEAWWLQLLEAFLGQRADFVAVVVDKDGPSSFSERLADRVKVPKELPLSAAFALVHKADCFIGVDSCMLHVADLARIPSVGPFGPTDSVRFGCRFAPAVHVEATASMDEVEIEAALGALRDVTRLCDAPIARLSRQGAPSNAARPPPPSARAASLSGDGTVREMLAVVAGFGASLAGGLRLARAADHQASAPELAALLHRVNSLLWQAEDQIRRDDLTNAHVAAWHRQIDRLNRLRHLAVERLDATLLAMLRTSSSASMNSETPATLIDRLSVLALRRAMAQRRGGLRPRSLDEQWGLLVNALSELLEDCLAGRRRFAVFQEPKFYGGDCGKRPAELIGSTTPVAVE